MNEPATAADIVLETTTDEPVEPAPAAIFRGQHAVVTGGGRGIGAAVADALAARGARLTLMGRTLASLEAKQAQLAGAHGVDVSIQPVDVTNEADVTKAFEAASSVQGPVKILVNNAGGADSAPFKRTDTALVQKMLDLNLMSVLHCTHAVLPPMLEDGYGRIVNIVSTAGLVGYRYVSAYVASKHAAIGLTRALALETAKSGVTVNAVCPGYVDTDMTQETIHNIVQKTGVDPKEAEKQITATSPQQRLVAPSEVASAVVWLAGPEQVSITGQALAVAGGEIM